MSGTPRGFAFPFHIDGTGGVGQVEGPEKIRDNVVQILLTALGERAMRRDYGTGLRHLLQEPMSDALFSVVQHQVAKALARWEPRVEVADVQIRGHGPLSGWPEGPGTLGGELPGDGVIAEVEFIIRATRQPVSLSVPVGLGGT